MRVLDRTGGDLRRAHEALGGPGQPVFVEVRAEAVEPGAGTRDAPARLGVISLVRASPVGEGAGCSEAPARYRFRASGNEPFWSVTVERDSVVFQQPEEPRRVAAPIVGAEADSNHYAVHARSGGPSPHTIRLLLTLGRCADSMSGALYSFSAVATIDGRSLTGCGRAGDLPSFP